jgi:NTE family protein
MQIGLALSGGGIRAAVFHLGVLRRLAEQDLLESVSQISTVSGGSLVLAALLSKADMQWPSSQLYRTQLYPTLKQLLTTVDLFTFNAIGWRSVFRLNTRLLTHRANVLADLLAERWGVSAAVRDLPDRPAWWINTTCFETGKNWRFAKREMGDWQFGRHYNPPVRLADAAAASAAVPYVIGTLTLSLPRDGWYRTDPATREPLERCDPLWTTVRLWDGGAYENLGLESMFKPQQGLIGCDFLICSDASGPLGPPSTSSPFNILHGHLASPRLFDISSDQIRSLRTRMFMAALESGKIKGAFLRMGNSVRDIDIKAGRQQDRAGYDRYQADREVALALKYPTDLRAITAENFDHIARHGYELADATLTVYTPTEFKQSLAWPCEGAASTE